MEIQHSLPKNKPKPKPLDIMSNISYKQHNNRNMHIQFDAFIQTNRHSQTWFVATVKLWHFGSKFMTLLDFCLRPKNTSLAASGQCVSYGNLQVRHLWHENKRFHHYSLTIVNVHQFHTLYTLVLCSQVIQTTYL